MTLWDKRALVQATGGTLHAETAITGVSIDTRTLQPGDLFIALHAERDAHAHAADALARGAACVMVTRLDGLPPGAPALLVPDTLAGLTALGQAGRARFQGRVVAVTGSVGKTTTKEMLRTALAGFGPVHAAEASYNNHWGVPLTLARLPLDAAFCVCEVGMNNPGEILPLARLVAPHAAVITTIGAAHIGHLGSLEAIADEKASLLDGLAPGGVAVLPADDAHLARLARHTSGPIQTFGRSDGATVHLTALHLAPDYSDIRATILGEPVTFRLAAPGAHMAMNALATLATTLALGLDPARAARALEAFASVAGRGQQRRVGDILLLDESYNANGASVRAALAVLHRLPATRHLAVLGDMLELGAFAEQEHAGLATDVAATADLLYTCGPSTRSLFDLVPPTLRGAHAGDAEALAPIVAAAIRPGDAVLVKGSLGSRMRLVVQALEAGAIPASPGVPL